MKTHNDAFNTDWTYPQKRRGVGRIFHVRSAAFAVA
jgi:hypothetical protein